MRTDHSRQPAEAEENKSNLPENDPEKKEMSRDIGSIDRQEGDMDNGETGGNFGNNQKSPPQERQK